MKVCRRKIVNWIVLLDINIMIITPGEYGSRFEIHQNSPRDSANTLNLCEIWTLLLVDFVAFRSQLYIV